MSTLGLEGVALVTGAASGIGQEVAFALAEAGVSGICFADLDGNGAIESAQASQKFAKHPDYRAIALEVDVTQLASVEKLIDTTIAQFGRIDHCINSAGVVNRPCSLDTMSAEALDRVLRVNVVGTTLVTQAVMRVMAGQEMSTAEGRNGQRSCGRGSIVNLGSVTSYVVGPKMLPYVTSKHALIGLTKASAVEGAVHHIRVNAVCPSYVVTPMTQPMINHLDKAPAMKESMLGSIGRLALPEEVAGAVVFLCSSAASYINGIGMVIDAGMTLSNRV